MTDFTIALIEHNNMAYKYFPPLCEALNIPICTLDEIDYYQQHVYIIITPATVPPPPPDRKATVIVWDLEPYHHCYNAMEYDAVWVHSQRYARERGYCFVPMTSSETYPGIQPTDGALYDITHISSIVPRRQELYAQLDGLRLSGNVWGEARHEALSHSRMVLEVYPYDDYRTLSSLRVNFAAMYRVPFVVEAGDDLMGLDGLLLEAPYQRLPEFVRNLTDHDLEGWGEQLYQYLCVENAFDKVIERRI